MLVQFRPREIFYLVNLEIFRDKTLFLTLPVFRYNNIMKKATLWKVSDKFLKFRTPSKAEFKKPKWIEFCEVFLNYPHLEIYLTEAKTTNSKYLQLEYKRGNYIALFSVRFSDHAPNKKREKSGDCDFFVGVTNFKVTTTSDAILAVQKWYEKVEADRYSQSKEKRV